jgi:uncharacterized protein YecE (DUF72 family)
MRRSSSATGKIRIGISGWRYEGWRGVFYPADLAQKRELEFASRAFPTIEINGSFYSLQTPQSYAAWHRDTAPDLVFGVKGGRYITHIRRLRDIEVPLANFFASGVLNLREKLGPFLWQFPPFFPYQAERFEAFFELLPRDTAGAAALGRRRDARMKGRTRLAVDRNRLLRHAVEIRHASFATAEFADQLRRHNIALVVADTAGRWPYLEEVTADFMYLRLHGDKELYASGYTDAALDRWAERIRAWAAGGEPADAARITRTRPERRPRDVYCYFDNDVKVRAPFDADALIRRLGLGRADETFDFPARAALRRARRARPLPPFRWARRSGARARAR